LFAFLGESLTVNFQRLVKGLLIESSLGDFNAENATHKFRRVVCKQPDGSKLAVMISLTMLDPTEHCKAAENMYLALLTAERADSERRPAKSARSHCSSRSGRSSKRGGSSTGAPPIMPEAESRRGAVMWKMNQSPYNALPDGWRDTAESQDLGDLRNWRRRLCYLGVQKSDKNLCITYVSEKSDAKECVANVLASVNADGRVRAVGIIRRIGPIFVNALDPKESEKALVSVEQYEIAVASQGHIGGSKPTLPTTLHAFEVRQSDDSEGGQMGCIFAFEDAVLFERWLAAVDNASQKLTRNIDSPALRLVES